MLSTASELWHCQRLLPFTTDNYAVLVVCTPESDSAVLSKAYPMLPELLASENSLSKRGTRESMAPAASMAASNFCFKGPRSPSNSPIPESVRLPVLVLTG